MPLLSSTISQLRISFINTDQVRSFMNKINQILLTLVALVMMAASTFAMAGSGPLFIPSGKVDLPRMAITLPFFRGQVPTGEKFLFVITDASSASVATQLGVAHSPILRAAAKLSSLRKVQFNPSGVSVFDHGTVDFTPVRLVVPGDGPNFFPPKQVQPGSVGSADYNPLAQLSDGSGTIINAPIIGSINGTGHLVLPNLMPDYSQVHDKVLALDFKSNTVTLQLTPGFTSDQPVVYLSFDANVPLAASLEAATLTQADSQFLSSGADLSLFALTNGETGKANAQRQGFNSALAGDGSPLNILTLTPASAGYSPLWNVNVGSWSNGAIASGVRRRLTNFADLKSAAMAGQITNPDGSPLSSAGIIVNCPVVQVLD